MDPDQKIVRVRYLSIDCISPASSLAWRTMLDDEERQRVDRFYFQRDRETFTAAHVLTRAMLSEATGGRMTSWRFVKGRYGKPELAPDHGNARLRFNLSHTRGLVACAISDCYDVGLDVEACDSTTDPRLADKYLAPEETVIIRSAPVDQGRCFFLRFWTLKEALIKATGEGLNRPLASFSFTLDPIRVAFHPDRDMARRDDNPEYWQFAQVRPTGNQFLALALRRPGARDAVLDVRAIRPNDLVNRADKPGFAPLTWSCY